VQLDQPLFEPDTFIIDRSIESPILEAIIASGRAWLKEMPKGRGRTRAEIPLLPLTLGPARSARLEWQRDQYGYYVATLQPEVDSWIVPSRDQLYYLDHVSGMVGRIGDGTAEQLLSRLLQLPPLNAIDADLVAAALAPLAPQLAPPSAAAEVTTITSPPVARLRIATHEPLHKRGRWSQPLPGRDATIDYAVATLSYGDINIEPDEDHPFYVGSNGSVVRIKRDLDREQKLLDALKHEQLQPLSRQVITSHHLPPHALGFKREEQWRTFVTKGVPRLH